MKRKSQLYYILAEHPGTYYSGEALAQQLGISRAGVWKALQTLKTDSHVPILSHPKKGYCIPESVDLLTLQGVQAKLRTKELGQVLYAERLVDSTNTQCKRLAAEGAVHGTVMMAEGQSGGKGRMGRSFCSPINTGLYFSVILRKNLHLPAAQQVTCCAAVAVAEAIEALYGTEVQIKWVNDIYKDGKKLCGILTEAAWNCEDGTCAYMVVGIGINVRQTTAYLPESLWEAVTSLEESGCCERVQRNELLAEILNRLEQQLEGLSEHTYLESYREHSLLTGKQVTAFRGTEQLTGIVQGIAEDGALLLELESGDVIALQSGEVTLHK